MLASSNKLSQIWSSPDRARLALSNSANVLFFVGSFFSSLRIPGGRLFTCSAGQKYVKPE